ncbi:MAG: hypothetical protein MSS60_00115 [Clostridiales bacterium]|nr:hypothetical protein [Clostridiales bacterium]
MDLEALKSALESTGIPIAYWSFPDGEAPPLPYLCYFTTGSNPLFADATVYFLSDSVRVELYTDTKDLTVEHLVEAALAGFHPKKDQEYLDTEQCWMTTYNIEV